MADKDLAARVAKLEKDLAALKAQLTKAGFQHHGEVAGSDTPAGK